MTEPEQFPPLQPSCSIPKRTTKLPPSSSSLPPPPQGEAQLEPLLLSASAAHGLPAAPFLFQNVAESDLPSSATVVAGLPSSAEGSAAVVGSPSSAGAVSVPADSVVKTAPNGSSMNVEQNLKMQTDLSSIRAHLKGLNGKDLANFQRGSKVGGRNNNQHHFAKSNNGARQVFDKISQPFRGDFRIGTGLGGAPLPHVPPPAPPRRAWVAAVSSNLEEKKLKLVYRPPNVENGEIIVEASDDALALAQTRWSNYLVGYFIEGRLPFLSVEGIAKSLWAKLGLAETLCFNKEFLFFMFSNATSRTKLLDHGPFLFGSDH